MSSRVQLKLKASGLKTRRFSNSNPFAIVYLIKPGEDDEILGMTEVAERTVNPDWLHVFMLAYQLGTKQEIKVAIYDCVLKANINKFERIDNLSDKKQYRYLGSDRFEISVILRSQKNYMEKTMSGNRGNITVSLETTKDFEKDRIFCFQIRGLGLVNTRRKSMLWNNLSNPFFEISRRIDKSTGAVWDRVYRSEMIPHHVNPVWDEAKIHLHTICNNDFKRPIRLQVFDLKKNGTRKSMGSFETNLEHFLAAKSLRGNADPTNAFTLYKDELDVGKLVVVNAGISEDSEKITEEKNGLNQVPSKPGFVDYLYGGCEVNLTVAIDFSSNNGSSHDDGNEEAACDLDFSKMNDYQKAIFTVGTILAKFDTDNKFPVWGFGLSNRDGVNLQLFQCGENNEVVGVNGMLDAYQDVISGHFEPFQDVSLVEIINAVSTIAKEAETVSQTQSKGRLSYSILLILTSGQVTHLEETKAALAKASESPLSVVIVGIGDGNFDDMRLLDNDIEGARDITKFVEFNAFLGDKKTLAEGVLDEIPNQLVDYFWDRGIQPHNY